MNALIHDVNRVHRNHFDIFLIIACKDKIVIGRVILCVNPRHYVICNNILAIFNNI